MRTAQPVYAHEDRSALGPVPTSRVDVHVATPTVQVAPGDRFPESLHAYSSGGMISSCPTRKGVSLLRLLASVIRSALRASPYTFSAMPNRVSPDSTVYVSPSPLTASSDAASSPPWLLLLFFLLPPPSPGASVAWADSWACRSSFCSVRSWICWPRAA